MTAEEAYIQYIQKSEANGSLDRLSTSRGAFAILYNQVKDRVVMYAINNNYTEVEQYVQGLLVSELELNGQLELPENFLSEQTIIGEVTNKEKCPGEVYKAEFYRINSKEKNFYLNNENYKPSFEWREFPYYLTEDRVKVLLDEGTDIEKIYLNYYKEPPKIEMEDDYNPESQFQTQDLGVSDYIAERILSACTGEFKISTGEEQGAAFKQLQNENFI